MTDTTKLRMTLPDAQRGGVLLTTAAQWAKSMLMAGHRLTLAIHPETRKEAQSRKFHAICGDIAKSGHALHGKPRTAEEWKVLLISGHATATKEPTEFVPGLEGELVNIRESTAAMGVRRMASLLEYSIAYCALHRIPTIDDDEVTK
jgi:hypothetical protein